MKKTQPLINDIFKCCFFGTFFILAILWSTNLIPPKHLQQQLIGATDNNRFTSCELALSLSIKQSFDIKSSLSAKTLSFQNDDPCLYFSKYSNLEIEENTERLRHRYIWGLRSIYAAVSYFIAEPDLEIFIQISTYFVISFFSFLLFRLNYKIALYTTPLLIYGLFFSGVSVISETPLALCFLWAWLAPSLYILLYDYVPEAIITMSLGMFSSFIWFMEGHIMMLLTLLVIVKISLQPKTDTVKNSCNSILFTIFLFHLGFVLTFLLLTLIKSIVFSPIDVFQSIANGAAHRLSALGTNGEPINLIILSKQLLFVGFQHTSTYQNVFLWKFILISTLIAFILIAAYIKIQKSVFDRLEKVFIFSLGLICLYIFIRLAITPNHSYIHKYMMSRYLGIPISLIWSTLILCIINFFKKTKT